MRSKTTHYLVERSKGRIYSAVLHGVVLLFIIIGLPDFMITKPPEEPVAITVELLPITNVSNVKPAEKPPEPEQKPEEKQAEQKKPSPPVKTAEAAPPPPPADAVPNPEEKKKEDKKPEQKEKQDQKQAEKKKEKPKEDPLAAILKSVKKTAQKETKEDKKKDTKPDDSTSPNKSISSQYNPTLPMTMSEKDAIMSQISKCWSVPAGAKDAQNLVVVVNAEYNVDGSYIRAEVARESMGKYQSDPFYRAAADAAVRAVQRCSPLTGLPSDKYETWKQMELRFDPKYMLN